MSLLLMSVRGWDNTRAIVWPEELGQWKIPMTSSGILATTSRLVAQCSGWGKTGINSRWDGGNRVQRFVNEIIIVKNNWLNNRRSINFRLFRRACVKGETYARKVMRRMFKKGRSPLWPSASGFVIRAAQAFTQNFGTRTLRNSHPSL